MWDTFLFKCACCERDVRDYPERKGRDAQIAPVCRFCEGEFGGSLMPLGSLKDRRIMRQLKALAECLHGTASGIAFQRMYCK